MYKVSGSNRREGNYKGPRVTHKEPQGQAKEGPNSPSALINDVRGDRVEMWDEKKGGRDKERIPECRISIPGDGERGRDWKRTR